MYLQITPTGQTGLVADISPYELPRTAFSRADNVRFNNGYAEKYAGSSQVFTVPSGEAPLALFSAQVEDRLHWVYCTANKLYRIEPRFLRPEGCFHIILHEDFYFLHAHLPAGHFQRLIHTDLDAFSAKIASAAVDLDTS